MARKVDEIEEINSFIGNKIREFRLAEGMSRQDLAEKIFVTHQQLQKYEKGTNRVSAGRLALIAQVLKRNIEDFYSGFVASPDQDAPQDGANKHQRMRLEVSRNFMKIKPGHQDAVNSLIRILANEEK